MGGHKPKKLVGAHRDWLLLRCQGGAFTLRGLVTELAERGLKVDYRSVWAFVHAEGLSFKNVWPAPSASSFGDPIRSVCINVSGLRLGAWPRWRSARPGPHKNYGV